jgi:hypothetical protein
MKTLRSLLRLVPLGCLVVAAACASPGDGSGAGSSDPDADPTAEEAAAGAAWSGDERTEESEEQAAAEDAAFPDTTLDAPLEDSAPFLEPEDLAGVTDDGAPLPAIDPSELGSLKSCRRAAGYRSGKRFTICVTHIDGKPVEVNTARAFLRMRAAAKKKGVHLHVVSGFRTMAKQRHLYHLYKTGHGNLAAPPGYSNHQSGHALDLNTSARGVYSWLAKHGRSYRFKRTVPSEAWHWEHW